MLQIPFTLLRARSDNIRRESINVGLVAFFEEGAKVYFDAPVWRLKALHPDLAAIEPLTWSLELEETLPLIGNPSQQLEWMRNGLGAISADEELGSLTAETIAEISALIEDVLEKFIQPPLRTIVASGRHNRQPGGTLQSNLRSWFRSAKLFSSKFEDLSRKRIVAGYPVDVEDGLYADFAFKNGAIHIIETLDLRGVEKVTNFVRGQAAFASVLFDQARRISPAGKRIAVTSSDNRAAVRSIISLVQRYADDVIVMESADDKQRLADFVSKSLNAKQLLTVP